MDAANSSVRGPPLIVPEKSGLVKDLITERGPFILAKRLGEKLVPKSPLLVKQ